MTVNPSGQVEPPDGAESADASLGDIAYERLFELLREMEYPSGSTLSETMLAQRLGIGRTPIREAVIKLEHEGFLTRQPQRGVVVNTLSLDDIRDISEIREELEIVALRDAADVKDPSLVAALRESLDKAEAAVADGISGLEYRLQYDREFHFLIADAGRNRRGARLLHSLYDAAGLDPWLRHVAEIPGQNERSLIEHRAIVEALTAWDTSQIEAALRFHARSYRELLVNQIKKAMGLE